MADVFGLSGSTLKSISIPIMATGAADDNGDFIFTISVYGNDLDSLANSSPNNVYKIKISAEAYDLTPNTNKLYKMITVDLSSYGITLAENETIAVSSSTDTVIPGYLSNAAVGVNDILDILKMEATQMLSFSMYAGTKKFDLASNTLFFNFTYERSYVGKAAYDEAVNADEEFEEMLMAVKDRYRGLDLSVFGDSISTYEGISNNTKYNATIANNQVWYNADAISESLLYDHTYTYWGRMTKELNMHLCVNNSWSGDSLGSKRYLTRAKQLHSEAGYTPDVIVVYFGINDTWEEGREVGELLDLIDNRGDRSIDEVVGEWYSTAVAKNGEVSNWDEHYATLLNTLMTEYPDAKIVCMSLVLNGAQENYYNVDKWVPLYNRAMKAMTDYLGITYVDQTDVVTGENCHAYMHDLRYLHPNAHGHELMFKAIIRTLYQEILEEW